jgi:hypothetical protein
MPNNNNRSDWDGEFQSRDRRSKKSDSGRKSNSSASGQNNTKERSRDRQHQGPRTALGGTPRPNNRNNQSGQNQNPNTSTHTSHQDQRAGERDSWNTDDRKQRDQRNRASQQQHRAGERDSWNDYGRRQRDAQFRDGFEAQRAGEWESWNANPVGRLVFGLPIDDVMPSVVETINMVVQFIAPTAADQWTEDGVSPDVQLQRLLNLNSGDDVAIVMPSPVSEGATPLTLEMMGEAVNPSSQTGPEALATDYRDWIIDRADYFGILDDEEREMLSHMTAQEALVWAQEQHVLAGQNSSEIVTGEDGFSSFYQGILEPVLQSYSVTSSDMSLDVMQWAANHIADQIDTDNPIEVEAAVNQILDDHLQNLLAQNQALAAQMSENNSTESLEQFNPVHRDLNGDGSISLAEMTVFQASPEAATASLVNQMRSFDGLDMGLQFTMIQEQQRILAEQMNSLGLLFHEVEEPFNPTQSALENMGLDVTSAALFGSHTPQLTAAGRDLSENMSYFETLGIAIDPARDYEPDYTLQLLIASILLEPVDWVVTGGEIIGDIASGNWGGALINSALLILPGVSGQMDNVIRAADDVVPNSAISHVDDLPSGSSAHPIPLSTPPPLVPSRLPGNPWDGLDPLIRQGRVGVYVYPVDPLTGYPNIGFPVFELDYIDIEGGRIIEFKSANGLRIDFVRSDGLPLYPTVDSFNQRVNTWIDENITLPTQTRLQIIEEGAPHHTDIDKHQTTNVPLFDEFKDFRIYDIWVAQDNLDPSVVAAIKTAVEDLSRQFPDWEIRLEFGRPGI